MQLSTSCMSEQWLYSRFLPFSCIVLCSIITHPVSMMKWNQQMYIHQVEDGVLLHFYFFFALILSFSAKPSGWAVLHTLPFFALCFMHAYLYSSVASDKHSRTFIGKLKKNNSLCKEETAPCCFLSVVVANHMFNMSSGKRWVSKNLASVLLTLLTL